MKRTAVVLLAAVLIAAATAERVRAQSNFGFELDFGYTGMGGDFGKVLSGGWVAEANLDYGKSNFRYGLGVELVSLSLEEPYQNESVAKVGFHLYTTYLFPVGSKVRPYVQGRIGSVRLTPEGETFAGVALAESEEEEEEGENQAPRAEGFEAGLLGGVTYAVSRTVSVDLSAVFSLWSTEDVDLSAIGLGNVDSGNSWSIRLGLRWKP